MSPALPYQPHQLPRQERLDIAGRQRHLLRWGPNDAPLLLMLHGWMDCAATFQFVVDAMKEGWQMVAPDLRGFGHSEWDSESYYFPDYLADLDALLDTIAPEGPVKLLGHSLGAMVAGLYAGVRPDRVKRLMLVEGFGLPDTRPEDAPARYTRWLRERRNPPSFDVLPGFDTVARRLMQRNPHLRADRAAWLARQLAEPVEGGVRYLADPKHKMVNPILYRLEEAKAVWRRIHCPVLWVRAGDVDEHPMAQGVAATLDERRACFANLSEVVIPQCGHMVQWDQPERLAETLQHWLAQHG